MTKKIDQENEQKKNANNSTDSNSIAVDTIIDNKKETQIASKSTDIIDIIDDDEDSDGSSTQICEDNIEDVISHLISTGHMFKAHVMAKKAYNKNPDNIKLAQAYALVLLKTGAIDDSRDLIYKILGVTPQIDEATEKLMISVEDLINSKFLENAEPGIVAKVGHIFKESWKYSQHCRDLEIASVLYSHSFEREKNTNTGMNAAWLAWLTGEDDKAKGLASTVLKLLPPFGLEATFSELIDLAEAQLLLGREDDACKLYEEAMKQSDKVNYISIVALLQQ